jgi:hypothetical protein
MSATNSSKRRRLFWWCAVPIILVAGAMAIPMGAMARCGGGSGAKAQRNACINNLRQIDGAKEQWAQDKRKSEGDLIVPAEVNEYIKGGAPKCPKGGVYRYGKVEDAPTCSIPGHALQQVVGN